MIRPALSLAVFTLALLHELRADHHGKSAAGSRPNIVFMMADDMGWNQPGFNGGKKELTPNIDKLAGESLKLTQYYTHSVCAPTRAAFLTGRYAFRTWSDWRSEDFGKPSYLKALGLTLAHNDRGEPTRRIHALDSKERTIAEALKEAGYFTALVGKWHMGEWLEEHLPMGQGFMHQYGHYAWGIDYYTKTIVHNAPARFAVYDWHRNQKPLQEEGYATDLFAAEAERVIASRKGKDKPFFLYLPFNAVHGPLNPPPGYTGKPDDPLAIRDAMLKNLDDAVGKIIGAVEENGFADNTIVIFTNGQRTGAGGDERPLPRHQEHHLRGRRARALPRPLARPHKARQQNERDDVRRRLVLHFHHSRWWKTRAGGKGRCARHDFDDLQRNFQPEEGDHLRSHRERPPPYHPQRQVQVDGRDAVRHERRSRREEGHREGTTGGRDAAR